MTMNPHQLESWIGKKITVWCTPDGIGGKNLPLLAVSESGVTVKRSPLPEPWSVPIPCFLPFTQIAWIELSKEEE